MDTLEKKFWWEYVNNVLTSTKASPICLYPAPILTTVLYVFLSDTIGLLEA